MKLKSETLNKGKTNVHRKSVRFGVISASLILFLGMVFFAGQSYMKDRIMPFVSIQGVSVGGLKTEDALARLKTNFPPNKSLIFALDNRGMGISTDNIDAKVDLDTAIAQAYLVGRGRSWKQPIKLTSTVDKDKLQNKLVEVLLLNSTDPKDASYSLGGDGALGIDPGQYSTSLNISATSKLLETQLVNAHPDNTIPIILNKGAPKITAEDLQAIKNQVQQYIDQPASILINGRLYAPKKDQKLGFIDIKMVNGAPTIEINDANVKSYIASVDKKATIASKPDLYFSNGELSQKGVAGASLDSDAAFTQYKQSVIDHQSTPLTLATTAIPPQRRIVEQPSTPGQFDGKYIEVDLSSQQLFQFEGDTLVGTHRISSGKRSTPTPVGTYSINFKTPRAFSAMYKLYMPYWMAFIGTKYGIHELPEWPGGKKEGQGHLGTPVSDGCIRLGVGEAKEVYDWTEIGTKVVIHQ